MSATKKGRDEIAEAFEHGCDMPDCTERVLDLINQHPEDLEEALATAAPSQGE